MGCREIRPLVRRRASLGGPDRRRVEEHLDLCPTCRDEMDDVQAGVLVGAVLPLALPPPDLTSKVLLRLPAASPIEIARRQKRQSLVYRNTGAAVFGATAAAALMGIILLEWGFPRAADLLPGVGLRLALAAKAILGAAGQPWLIGLAILASLLLPAILARRSGSPTRRIFAGAGAAVVALLLVNTVAVGTDASAITATLDVADPVAGDVVTLAGDITVRGEVQGDVVSLAGDIRIEPGAFIHGSVMSAAGTVTGGSGQIAQRLVRPGALPLALQARPNGDPAQLDAALIARVVALVGAIVTLLAGWFMLAAWPRLPLEAGHYLARSPVRALAVGAAATAGLLLLTLGGMVLLAATVAGVLLVPVLLLLVHLPFVAGIAAVGHLLGTRLAGRPSLASGLWGVAAQVIVLLGIGLLVPIGGWLLFYVAGSAGLGGALLMPRTAVTSSL